MKILIDANLLVRLASPGDPQRDVAISAMQVVVDRGHDACVVPQVLYEFWVVATRPKENNGLGLSVDVALGDLQRIIGKFELLPDFPSLFEDWLALIEQHQIKGKLAHDARLVASMVRHGVTHMLTFNAQDFARFDFVTVIPPVDAGSLPTA